MYISYLDGISCNRYVCNCNVMQPARIRTINTRPSFSSTTNPREFEFLKE